MELRAAPGCRTGDAERALRRHARGRRLFVARAANPGAAARARRRATVCPDRGPPDPPGRAGPRADRAVVADRVRRQRPRARRASTRRRWSKGRSRSPSCTCTSTTPRIASARARSRSRCRRARRCRGSRWRATASHGGRGRREALARRAYDDFLHRRQDPALLEKAAGNQFTARVFPIAANGDKHLVISLQPGAAGPRYMLPLRGLAEDRARRRSRSTSTRADGTRHEQKLTQARLAAGSRLRRRTSSTDGRRSATGGLVAAHVEIDRQRARRRATADARSRCSSTPARRARSGFAALPRRGAQARRRARAALRRRRCRRGRRVRSGRRSSIYAGLARDFGDAQVAALVERGAAGASDLAPGARDAARTRAARRDRSPTASSPRALEGASSHGRQGARREGRAHRRRARRRHSRRARRDGARARRLPRAGRRARSRPRARADRAPGSASACASTSPIEVAGATLGLSRAPIASARAGHAGHGVRADARRRRRRSRSTIGGSPRTVARRRRQRPRSSSVRSRAPRSTSSRPRSPTTTGRGREREAAQPDREALGRRARGVEPDLDARARDRRGLRALRHRSQGARRHPRRRPARARAIASHVRRVEGRAAPPRRRSRSRARSCSTGAHRRQTRRHDKRRASTGRSVTASGRHELQRRPAAPRGTIRSHGAAGADGAASPRRWCPARSIRTTIRRYIRRHIAKITYCYERQLLGHAHAPRHRCRRSSRSAPDRSRRRSHRDRRRRDGRELRRRRAQAASSCPPVNDSTVHRQLSVHVPLGRLASRGVARPRAGARERAVRRCPRPCRPPVPATVEPPPAPPSEQCDLAGGSGDCDRRRRLRPAHRSPTCRVRGQHRGPLRPRRRPPPDPRSAR